MKAVMTLALVSAIASATLFSAQGFTAQPSEPTAKKSESKKAKTASSNAADETPLKSMRFRFEMAELTDVISAYAKASGQKIIVDPSVRGKVTILTTKEVSMDEAFALMCSALAVNGFSYSEQGDTLIIMSARNIQRNLIPLVTELPPLKPQRMASLLIPLKHASADDVNKYLRILPSKDGEMTPYEPTNSLIVTDWVSNLHRIMQVVSAIDQPGAKGTAHRASSAPPKENSPKAAQ